MSAVQFSVPDDLNAAFEAAFAGENKDLLIAELMREALERRQQSSAAIRRILDRRAQAPILAETAVAALRHEGRP